MTNNVKHVIHQHISSGTTETLDNLIKNVDSGLGKTVKYGELLVDPREDKECIAIKNSKEKFIKFVNENQMVTSNIKLSEPIGSYINEDNETDFLYKSGTTTQVILSDLCDIVSMKVDSTVIGEPLKDENKNIIPITKAIGQPYLDGEEIISFRSKIEALATTAQDAKAAIDAFLDKNAVSTGVVDTLKEIQEYITTDGAAADKMVKDIAANASAITKEVADRKVAIQGVIEGDISDIYDSLREHKDIIGGLFNTGDTISYMFQKLSVNVDDNRQAIESIYVGTGFTSNNTVRDEINKTNEALEMLTNGDVADALEYIDNINEYIDEYCVIKQSGHTINEEDIEAFRIKSKVTEGYYTQHYSLLEQEKEKIKLCTVYKNFDEEGQTASEYNYGLIISQDTEYQQYTSLQGGLHKLFVTNSGVYVSDDEYAPEGGDFGHRVLTKHDTLNYVNKENNRITEEGLESCIFSINPSNGYSQSISLQGNGMQIESYYKSYISLAVGQSKITLDNDGVIINGKLSADAIYQTSDETMKTFGDEIPVDFEKLSKLRKAYFSFNESPNKQEIGVSAQEVKEIYPEIVGSNGNGKLCVDYSKLSVVALAAIDKLNQRLTEIEEKLNKL